MKFFLNNYYRYLVFPIIIAVLCIGTVSLIKSFVFQSYQQSILSNVKAQLRQDLTQAEYKAINRSLKDFEDFQLLKCSRLKMTSPQNVLLADFSQSNGCDDDFKTRDDFFSVAFESVNGGQFFLEALTPIPMIYKISFAAINLSFLILIFSLFFVMAYKEKQSKRIELLAAGLAHDLRSPAGALNALRAKLSSVDFESAHLAGTIADRINDIAEDVLKKYRSTKSSRLKAAALEPKTYLPYSLKELLESIIKEAQITHTEKPVQISLILEPPFSDFSNHSIPKSDLGRALSNLINNSAESILQSGFVVVEAKATQNGVEIFIRDNGVGMSSDQIDRALSGQSSKSTGHGIGLKSTRDVIEQFGGKFKIQSELNRGTTIQIQLLAA